MTHRVLTPPAAGAPTVATDSPARGLKPVRSLYFVPPAVDESGRCCAVVRHGTAWAYRRYGCRCPGAEIGIDLHDVAMVADDGHLMPIAVQDRVAVAAVMTRQGKTARQIAVRLQVSRRTAQRYQNAAKRHPAVLRAVLDGV